MQFNENVKSIIFHNHKMYFDSKQDFKNILDDINTNFKHKHKYINIGGLSYRCHGLVYPLKPIYCIINEDGKRVCDKCVFYYKHGYRIRNILEQIIKENENNK